MAGVRIRLAAFDMDGTLLDDSKRIPEANKNALRKLHAAGVEVALASGRITSLLKQFAEELEIPCHLIGFNGAHCAIRGSDDMHRSLPVDRSDALIDACVERKLHLNLYFAAQENELYATSDPDLVHHSRMYTKLNSARFTLVPSYAELKGRQATKGLIIADDVEHRDRIYDELLPLFSDLALVKTRSSDTEDSQFYVEFMRQDVNKATALAMLEESHGIPLAAIAAFGDSDNDAEMLGAAGHSVCLANGTELAKQRARKVSPHTNEECGVAHEVELLLESMAGSAAQ